MKPDPTPEERARWCIAPFNIHRSIKAELLQRIASEIRDAERLATENKP